MADFDTKDGNAKGYTSPGDKGDLLIEKDAVTNRKFGTPQKQTQWEEPSDLQKIADTHAQKHVKQIDPTWGNYGAKESDSI